MADGMTTMFGKAYDTVGSADKNLILQTRGDLKVRWGNKYIDLIKNGKINVDIDFLNKVDSKDSIYKDGIYLVEKEDNNEVWLSVGGSLINLLGEVGTTYVSFLAPLEVTVDLKLMALTNAGFYYETLDKAKEANIKLGIIYIIDEQLFYKVKEGNYSKYELELTIPNPLILGNITINGTSGRIYGSSNLELGLGDSNYISITSDKIKVEKEIMVDKDLLSSDYVVDKDGYRLYIDDLGTATLEIDKVIIRELLVYSDVIDVLYSDLQRLVNESLLIPTKKYRIIDFQNEWEVTRVPQYEDITTPNTNPIQGKAKNVWPIVVRAKTKNTLYKEFYFSENEKWIGEYDFDFYHLIRLEVDNGKTTNIFSKGRITKLTDEHGNTANYDFKHKLFKYISTSDDVNTWYYTFNIANPSYQQDTTRPYTYSYMHLFADASLLNEKLSNNIIYIPSPELEDTTITDASGTLKEVKRILPSEKYIIFSDCSTMYPYDNQILSSFGKYVVSNDFYNNRMLELYNESEETILFNLSFHDNTFLKIRNCVLDAPMLFNIFDKDLLNVNFKCNQMSNNHITGTIYTEENASAYPIEVGTFSDNTIHDIRKTKITCSNNNITNNTIHDIAGYEISNTSIMNNEIQDLIGDDTGSMPDDPNSGGGNGGSTPLGTGILVTEPTSTSVNSKMHGVFTTSSMHENTAESSVRIGYIDQVSESYGTPTAYGIHVEENGNMVDFSSIRFARKSDNSFDIMANITANELSTYKRIHLWVQFSLVSELGYINVYQAAGSGSSSGGDSGGGESGGGTNPTPTQDSSLDTFINKITGGDSSSEITTVLANVISASNTPNTYSYLQSGFNYVSGKSDNLKAWMLANMLAELTPYVSGGYSSKTRHSGDTATNYFVNAAKCYGGLKLDFVQKETTYMERIYGALEYALFKHANYASSNTAAANARTELRGKGISQATMRNDSDPSNSHSYNYFTNDDAVHVLPVIPDNMPSNAKSDGDWQYTQTLINQYPTGTTQALHDKELDEAYICKILGANQSKYINYVWANNDISIAGGNQIKKTFKRARPGTQHNLYEQSGSGFDVPAGGEVYLCNCSVEFDDRTEGDSEYNYDCSATNNGKTYCQNDIKSFTDVTDTENNPYRSYSSGHSAKSFFDALLLVEVLGDSMSQDGYTSRFTRVHQYCLNRVIVRAHWLTDTIAGRLAANMVIGYYNGCNELHQSIAAL